ALHPRTPDASATPSLQHVVDDIDDLLDEEKALPARGRSRLVRVRDHERGGSLEPTAKEVQLPAVSGGGLGAKGNFQFGTRGGGTAEEEEWPAHRASGARRVSRRHSFEQVLNRFPRAFVRAVHSATSPWTVSASGTWATILPSAAPPEPSSSPAPSGGNGAISSSSSSPNPDSSADSSTGASGLPTRSLSRARARSSAKP